MDSSKEEKKSDNPQKREIQYQVSRSIDGRAH